MKLDKRKTFILVLVLLLIIVVALILILTLAGKKHVLNGEDMPTKAYYKQSGNNIKVVLKKPSDKKHVWDAFAEKDGCVKIDDRSTIGSNVYVISSAAKTKSVVVSFELVGKKDHKDIIYRINLSVYCDKNGKVTVEGATYTKLGGVTYGEVAGKKFSVLSNEAGEMYLYIDGDDTWDYVKPEETIIVSGPITLENMTEFIVVSKEDDENKGEAEFSQAFFAENLAKKIVLNVTKDKDGKLTLRDFVVSDYAPEKVIDKEAEKEFTDKYGTVKLPKDAVKVKYEDKTAYASKDDKEGFAIHQVEFYLNDVKCEYCFTNEAKDQYDLIWRLMGAEGIKQLNEVINKKKVNIMIIGEKYAVATWEDGENIFELFTYKGDENMIKNVLKEII